MERLTKIIDDYIHSQPTTYDVDKVVEQLEVLSDSADDNISEESGTEQYWDGFGDGIEQAIRVLKTEMKG